MSQCINDINIINTRLTLPINKIIPIKIRLIIIVILKALINAVIYLKR